MKIQGMRPCLPGEARVLTTGLTGFPKLSCFRNEKESPAPKPRTISISFQQNLRENENTRRASSDEGVLAACTGACPGAHRLHWERWSPHASLHQVAAVTLDVGRRFDSVLKSQPSLFCVNYRLHNLVEVGPAVSPSLLMGFRKSRWCCSPLPHGAGVLAGANAV